MKNKLVVLLLVVLGLVLISGTILAKNQENNMYVDEMREEELQNYEAILPLTQNSNLTLRTGINLGTITHLIDGGSINLDNQMKKLFMTGQIDYKLNLNTKMVKEINFETEYLINSYEADFISEYEDKSKKKNNTFDNENDDYSRFDINVLLNKDNTNNLNKTYYGFGLETEDKTFIFDNTSTIEKYNIVKNRPYLMRKIYTTGGSHEAIMIREWQLSYIDTENTIGINNKNITTELRGLGLMFDIEIQMKPKEDFTIGGGYTFKYDYMIEKEDNSGDKLINELGLNKTSSLEESLTESSHFIYVSATYTF
jgi:hypothetical protein